jgi:hypothetical protein
MLVAAALVMFTVSASAYAPGNPVVISDAQAVLDP